MKFLSLLALCSMLLAIPACKDNGCCRKSTCVTTTTTSDNADEVGEYVDKENLDKEDLDEQEIVEVMDNK